MSRNVIDFNSYKFEKELRNYDKDNLELFKRIIAKDITDLTKEEELIYSEFEVKYSTIIEGDFNILILGFRGIDYIVNNLGTSFEFIDKFDNVLLNGIYY